MLYCVLYLSKEMKICARPWLEIRLAWGWGIPIRTYKLTFHCIDFESYRRTDIIAVTLLYFYEERRK